MQTPATPATHRDIQGARAIASTIPVKVLKHLHDQIHEICVIAQRNGRDDMSGKEIQERYEAIYGKRIEASSVSARVNNLVAANRLERLETMRPCRITGRDIHPVRVPLTQARLVG
jgi:hypothetical protein